MKNLRSAYVTAAGLLGAFGAWAFMKDVPGLLGLSSTTGFLDMTGMTALFGLGFIALALLNLASDRFGTVDPLMRRSTVALNLTVTLVFVRVLGLDIATAQTSGWVLLAALVGVSVLSIVRHAAARSPQTENL